MKVTLNGCRFTSTLNKSFLYKALTFKDLIKCELDGLLKKECLHKITSNVVPPKTAKCWHCANTHECTTNITNYLGSRSFNFIPSFMYKAEKQEKTNA